MGWSFSLYTAPATLFLNAVPSCRIRIVRAMVGLAAAPAAQAAQGEHPQVGLAHADDRGHGGDLETVRADGGGLHGPETGVQAQCQCLFHLFTPIPTEIAPRS